MPRGKPPPPSPSALWRFALRYIVRALPAAATKGRIIARTAQNETFCVVRRSNPRTKGELLKTWRFVWFAPRASGCRRSRGSSGARALGAALRRRCGRALRSLRALGFRPARVRCALRAGKTAAAATFNGLLSGSAAVASNGSSPVHISRGKTEERPKERLIRDGGERAVTDRAAARRSIHQP